MSNKSSELLTSLTGYDTIHLENLRVSVSLPGIFVLSPPFLSSCFEFSFSVYTQVLNGNVRGLSRPLLNLRNFKENLKKINNFKRKKIK